MKIKRTGERSQILAAMNWQVGKCREEVVNSFGKVLVEEARPSIGRDLFRFDWIRNLLPVIVVSSRECRRGLTPGRVTPSAECGCLTDENRVMRDSN